MRANTYYQSLILHNNAGPLGTAASLHASNGTLAAIPNVTLLEAPWANHDGETDVCWPYPEIKDHIWVDMKSRRRQEKFCRKWGQGVFLNKGYTV